MDCYQSHRPDERSALDFNAAIAHEAAPTPPNLAEGLKRILAAQLGPSYPPESFSDDTPLLGRYLNCNRWRSLAFSRPWNMNWGCWSIIMRSLRKSSVRSVHWYIALVAFATARTRQQDK